ncbi:hypothetical protein OAG1_16200 [Agarivorans sp. OAG1]|uniref:hypothetical protein n=1 Tax=Agarivorans sp. OAG1 TaxID=3082387 RepID=UPI002B2AAF78|nr:hypothetical protein OAG1_16200 [Agarivorans sp. OAG1]
MVKLVIFGTGDLARLLSHYVQQEQAYDLIGYTADQQYCLSDNFANKPVIAYQNLRAHFPDSDFKVLVAVGYQSLRAKASVFEKVKGDGYSLANFISNKAIVDPTTTIGSNNIVFPGANVEPFVSIGDNNILWNQSHICHDSHIGSHNFFAAKALIGGKTTVGNGCFLGFNSSVLQELDVADETLLGAGGTLVNSSQKHTQYLGLPAKAIKSHKPTGITV